MHVTVIIPAYNAAATIAQAIASVLGQTHRDLRLIVVDDGSTDASAAIAERDDDPRLILLRQGHAGVSAARNRGLAEADGHAVLFLDADDWLVPEALATLADGLTRAPDAVAVVGGYARVGAIGTARACRVHAPTHAPSDLLPALLVQNLFANGGHILIRARAARRAGAFRADIAYGEDWEFFIRLALLGPFAFVPAAQPLLFVRSCPEGAYRRLATNPESFTPCMAAIFGNPDLLARFGPQRLRSIRRRAEAENAWIIGRECIRHGRGVEGRGWLAQSVRAAPSLRRLALLTAAYCLPILPMAWRGPFIAYRQEADFGETQAGASKRPGSMFTVPSRPS